MIRKLTKLLLFTSILFFSPAAAQVSPGQVKTLHHSLNPNSIAQHLALYELYPDTEEGKKALQKAWMLLTGGNNIQNFSTIPLPQSSSTLQNLIAMVNKQPQETIILEEQELQIIERLAARLPHTKLRGHYATSEEEVLNLPNEQIDLARGLFLSQLPDEPQKMQKIRSYEAAIDLIVLQLLAKIPPGATPAQKIAIINQFIFEDLDFRFPAKSTYAKDIDLYTFLPSVLDSRRGVCLGVSILYLCIAQRLQLPLEIITPPGHIFVRYREGEIIINIETTARGINPPSEMYLSVNTRKLKERNIRETIGLAHFNQASVYWQNDEHHKALDSYAIARKYMGEDPLLMELMAYNYLFIGETEKGKAILAALTEHIPDYAVSKETVAEDFINGKADANGIKACYMKVDEDRNSLLEKKEALEKVIAQYPEFRSGMLALANTLLQLHQEGQALELLEKYHDIYAEDPTVEYYLSVLHGKRLNYPKAWEHLQAAELLTAAREHFPKALRLVRKELTTLSPE